MADRRIDDIRIKATRPLIQPAILTEEIPRSDVNTEIVGDNREAITEIIQGRDSRLLVIAEPCSVHNPAACLEFAEKLKVLHDRYIDRMVLVMRAYFEKPRTVGGWKGLINDPELDGTHKINSGLRMARQYLKDLADIGIPAATEFLDTTVPQHIADLVSWGAIGARTVESQTHRELASGLSTPVGFKNATDGRIQPAVDAVLAAGNSHWFPSTTKDGVASLSETTGNDACHIILRGGQSGPNYSETFVIEACERLETAGLRPSVMIDCSHGNSNKDHRRQMAVVEDITFQRKTNPQSIFGVMIESHLVEGRQDYDPSKELVYGQSITDACVDFVTLESMLSKF